MFRRSTHPLDGKPQNRMQHAVVAALTLCILACSAQTWATSCVSPPIDGPIPDHVREALHRFRTDQPAEPGGYVRRVEQLAQNRRDVAAGLITEEEAEARGGQMITGTANICVLPLLFANSDEAPWNVNSLETQLFVYSSTGTLRDYFEEISYGNFAVDGTVAEWRRVQLNDTDYEGSDNGLGGGAGTLLAHGLPLHDAVVDFGQFDNDGPDGYPNSGDDDHVVDFLIVVQPEAGGECGSSSDIWSHQNWYEQWHGELYETNDSAAGGGRIYIDRYAMTAGTSCTGGMIEIGIFAHEFGHVLGLPDLYDSNDQLTGDSEGIGEWGLMGSGCYNTHESPSHMIAHSKHHLGWLTYFNVASNNPHLCLPPVETFPTAARVWSFGAPSHEYFLVENRQPIGFDQDLHGEGLVIYHVDDDRYNATYGDNSTNADETFKSIDVECADAYTALRVVDADELDDETNRGDPDDLWCAGGGEATFNAVSIPDSRSNSGVATAVAINNIGPCAGGGGGIPPGYVCGEYSVGVASPVDVCIEDCIGDNCNEIATCMDWWSSPDIWIDNDGDGDSDIPAPGVKNKIWTRVHNLGPDVAVGTTVELYVAKGAMGLTWPDDADAFLGVTGQPIIAADEEDESYLIWEYSDLFNLVGHYCIGAVINQAQDPTNGNAAQLTNNIAQINSQVLFARAGGLGDQGPSQRLCPGPFEKETKIYLHDGFNPTGGLVEAEVRIGTPPDFDDAVIPENWSLEILPSSGPFMLMPGESDSITVWMGSDHANHGDWAHVPLTLWDIVLDAPIGGVVLDYQIDCFNAMAPENGFAHWLEPRGDRIGDVNVLVEWDPVTLDEEGNPETLMFYEVFRTDTHTPLWDLIDKVAIDADPGGPKFQWYDHVPRGLCPTTFTYKIRAIDGTGGASLYSIPFVLECESTSVEAGSDIAPLGRPQRLWVYPNPANPSTTTRFELDRAGTVDLSIYNARGEHVRRLVSGFRSAGEHEVTWDGRNDRGRLLPSGVYYCRFEGGGLMETQVVVLVR